MKLITRDTDYAVRALCAIARQKEKIISAGFLVKELKVPRPFLRKILQRLQKEGVLYSYKGAGGGFKLNLAPSKIRLVDLISTFQGKNGELELNECIFKKRLCPQRSSCLLRYKICKIEKYVFNKLGTITIASLL